VQFQLTRISQGNPLYLAGRLSREGWVVQMPFAFVVKTPLGLLGLFALAGYTAFQERRLSDVEWLLRDYLVALGAREEEIGAVDVRAFLSQARGEEDDYAGPITMVGKAAFTTRDLGGIPVYGNRFHVTVTPQGELHRVKGRWTPIDYAHSVLAVDLTEDDVISLAVSALAATSARF